MGACSRILAVMSNAVVERLFPVAVFLLTVLKFSASPAKASDPSVKLQERISQMLASAPSLLQGHLGFEFVDADTGELLAAREEGSFFSPASNAKLYTTAAALVRLGASYRFKTVVRTDTVVDSRTSIVPDLILVGGGDPNLSGRVLPFAQDAKDQDPLTAVNQLADEIKKRGIQEVAGDIVADDTRYPFAPYPDGWTFDDGLWYYGAPVSALAVNDNSIRVKVHATTPGELAAVRMDPEFGYFTLINQVVTVDGTTNQIHFARTPGSNELVISGTAGASALEVSEDVAVVNPAQFSAEALKAALEERGITVRGEARAFHRDLSLVPDLLHAPYLADLPRGTELASINSAPLSQIVQVVNKVSQNLHAEMLLREVGLATHGVGTLDAGLDERNKFLTEAGVTADSSALVDGSGLARQGLTSPAATIALLRYMWHRPERDAWLASLPVGGVDGSLRHRFKGIEGAERLHAKTGSLSHVSSLSGYLQTRSGRSIAFSIMANAEVNNSVDVQRMIDGMCGLFLGL